MKIPEIKEYMVRQWNGYNIVLRLYDRGANFPQPNFDKSKMALTGILQEDETLESWYLRKVERLKNVNFS